MLIMPKTTLIYANGCRPLSRCAYFDNGNKAGLRLSAKSKSLSAVPTAPRRNTSKCRVRANKRLAVKYEQSQLQRKVRENSNLFKSGGCYQINLAQRFKAEFSGSYGKPINNYEKRISTVFKLYKSPRWRYFVYLT